MEYGWIDIVLWCFLGLGLLLWLANILARRYIPSPERFMKQQRIVAMGDGWMAVTRVHDSCYGCDIAKLVGEYCGGDSEPNMSHKQSGSCRFIKGNPILLYSNEKSRNREEAITQTGENCFLDDVIYKRVEKDDD